MNKEAGSWYTLSPIDLTALVPNRLLQPGPKFVVKAITEAEMLPAVITPYTAEKVASLLADPIKTQNLLSKANEHKAFLGSTLQATDRLTVAGFEECSKEYSGIWYGQGVEMTCVPWAIVNASAVVGIVPDPGYIAKLLNFSGGFDNASQSGMNIGKARDLQDDSGIKSTKVYLEDIGVFGYYRKSWPYDKSGDPREVCKANGSTIKNQIDAGKSIITAVWMSEYYSKTNSYGSWSHAICISGYRITGQKYFDVQVIDSNVGIVWMALEHISQGFRYSPNDAFSVSTKAA